MARRVPILCYHRVYAEDDGPSVPPVDEYCGHVMLDEFRRQMEYLVANRFHAVTYKDLTAWIRNGAALPDRAVAIEFADARLNAYQHGYPLLKQLGLTGTLSVVTRLANGADLGTMSDYPSMNWQDIKTMLTDGWDIVSHTCTHPLLGELFRQVRGPEKCLTELIDSRQEIEAKLNISVASVVYPAGNWSAGVERTVKDHYQSAGGYGWSSFSAVPLYNTAETDPYRLTSNNISAQLSLDEFRAVVDAAI